MPILLLVVVACGDDGDGDDSSATEDRPCSTETPVTVPATTTPSTGTQPPSTGTAATDTTGEGAEPSGFAGRRPSAPDDSVVDVELEPVTGESTVPPSTVAPKPEVSLPDEPPTEDINVTDIEDGEGPEARNGDYIELRYVGVAMSDGEEFDSNYDQEDPLGVTIGSGQVIQGFDQGLVGLREGGVRQIDIPAQLAYGEEGADDESTAGTTVPEAPEGPVPPTTTAGTDVGTDTTASEAEGLANPADTTAATDEETETTGTTPADPDTTAAPDETTPGQPTDGPPSGPLSFVVEAERLIRRPNVNNVVEPSWCTNELVVDERREGSGDEAVEEGDTVRAFLVMLRGDNLFQVDNNWNQGEPTTIQLVPSQDEGVPSGLIDGIEGMKPGGRRVLTIPPSLAFGDEGVPQIGLPADKDVIVIVDLVDVTKA